MEVVRHIKTGRLYTVTGARINTTNAQSGQELVEYEGSGGRYAREAGEFWQKFERVKIEFVKPPTQPQCWCEACDLAVNKWRSRMALCPECGDKRCERSRHHDNACSTGSVRT